MSLTQRWLTHSPVAVGHKQARIARTHQSGAHTNGPMPTVRRSQQCGNVTIAAVWRRKRRHGRHCGRDDNEWPEARRIPAGGLLQYSDGFLCLLFCDICGDAIAWHSLGCGPEFLDDGDLYWHLDCAQLFLAQNV